MKSNSKTTTFQKLELSQKFQVIERFLVMLPEGSEEWDVVVSALIKINPDLDRELRFVNPLQLGSIGMSIFHNLNKSDK